MEEASQQAIANEITLEFLESFLDRENQQNCNWHQDCSQRFDILWLYGKDSF